MSWPMSRVCGRQAGRGVGSSFTVGCGGERSGGDWVCGAEAGKSEPLGSRRSERMPRVLGIAEAFFAGTIYSVGQVNRMVHGLLQDDPVLSNLAVQGEISNFKHHT